MGTELRQGLRVEKEVQLQGQREDKVHAFTPCFSRWLISCHLMCQHCLRGKTAFIELVDKRGFANMSDNHLTSRYIIVTVVTATKKFRVRRASRETSLTKCHLSRDPECTKA